MKRLLPSLQGLTCLHPLGALLDAPRRFASSKKGGKGKKESPKMPSHGRSEKMGHGALDRPPRALAREADRVKRATAASGGVPPATPLGPIHERDPVLAALLASTGSDLATPLPVGELSKGMGGVEEPEDVGVMLATHRFAGVPAFPDAYKGRVYAVPTSEDLEDATDLEDEGEGEEGGGGTTLDERSRAALLAYRRASGGAPLLPFLPRGRAGEVEGRASDMAASLLAADQGLKRAQAATAAASGLEAQGPPTLFTNEDGELLDPAEAMGLDDPALASLVSNLATGRSVVPTQEEVDAEMAAWDSEEESRINGPWGTDGVHKIPRGILEEFSQPLEFGEVGKGLRAGPPASMGGLYRESPTVREGEMSPAERAINAKRKALRAIIEAPVPVATRPLWPLYSLIVGADTVRLVTSGGVVDSMRCMVVVGNGMGGVGIGMGKHKDAFAATKQALERAQRDMIHVPTRNGCLHHDLLGKKNGVRVLLRANPATGFALKGSPMVVDVLELAGVKTASAKIYGNHRRTPYVVAQALFNAFNHITSPQQEAVKRGLRLVQHTVDRLNPNVVYPFSPKGPRHMATNKRFVV